MEEPLIIQLKQGDRQAFERLYRKYWRSLFDRAYKRLQSREETEELVQELFTQLWARRDSLVITSSLEAYLFTALRNQIFSHLRTRIVQRKYATLLVQREHQPFNPVEDQIYYEELAATFQNSVEKLPEKYRTVYQLSRHQNLTYREIAKHLNLPIDTVEKQMSKALQLLRMYLKDYVIAVVLSLNNLI
ncbi:RNA polymerase sigma-70 factor (ECF subfamily) [Larkinella arboricola]|uniref:RNA polymerase sigma-70 factor (ECF subfamily) n=1 Tax=Larkinella arboricola TaxID=643671 RepID=A0A327WJ20_LARAB|nr:RNA polymerase sigma-70 factor [Larkinella arboricola]RAJ91120.1 RNA polymerase sigma-70 factor (ECF subfamily) [Larkinella arboricola]